MEGALKICVYAIAKDEEKFVERFCESAKDADLILITDTGSTDNTKALAEKARAQVFDVCVTPWRFDFARNAAITLIPKDVGICISLDLDEVLESGWREEIERVWEENTTRLRYVYDWGHGHKFNYDKIHARHGYYWWHPCHEYLRVDGRVEEVFAQTGKTLVKHLPDSTKSRGQYLNLLELSVKEDPICPRNSFYYGRELSFYGRWDDAIVELKRYLDLPGATWINERSYAMRTLGKCFESKQDWKEAEKWYLCAAAEAPFTREAWCALSLLYYNLRKWPDSYSCAMRALDIKDRELVYTVSPEVWGAQPHDLAAIAAWNMGLKKEALFHAKNAAALCPSDMRLASNVRLMENVSPIIDEEIVWAA